MPASRPSILQDGASVLRERAVPVAESEFGTKAFADELTRMTAALDAEADGVALAAPQIGIGKRIFIVRYDRMAPPREEGEPDREPEVGVYVNPEITKTSRKRVKVDEGCLSVRGTYGKALRHERATVRAKDENGKKFERGGGSILAQAFQHEIDHLNGILFIDHASDLVEVEAGERPKRPRGQEKWKLDAHA